MLRDKLKHHKLILASGSPRRKQFFEEMELDFEIRLKAVEEVYPNDLKGKDIPEFLAQLKASVFEGTLKANEILITSDTIVWYKNKSLAKPKDKNEACEMLAELSNDWHDVITSVAFTTPNDQITVSHTTKVKFKALTKEEILYYVEKFNPYDKAGAYGIQEWLGLIGIEGIQGGYTNVVGLPTHLVYKTLTDMVE